MFIYIYIYIYIIFVFFEMVVNTLQVVLFDAASLLLGDGNAAITL